ncbi:hypothetical protein AB0D34_39700 [Streptomyces sp. NPDC048420]|uniref:MGH1-like glycoside hydrolase domain-containing protein n=1 Tax=Streptomyces sp. NPDC048420 TaxID=3155755 RepID=UPI0034461DA5
MDRTAQLITPPTERSIAYDPPGSSHSLHVRAARVLEGNWTGASTVPSRSLYPHQWSWDSAFIAIGLRHLSPLRAQTELETLLAAQWGDGRIPHIVFNPSVPLDAYFPSPDFWRSSTAGRAAGAPRTVQTSGIVQPPVHALAAWLVHCADPGLSRARGFLTRVYPRLAAWHRYLLHSRDLGGGGLASVVHPWEQGMDNSPAWDLPLSRVTPAPARSFRRADLDHGAAEDRPTDLDYGRYVRLAADYRDAEYADGTGEFAVEDPAFNALLIASEHALARIAGELGAPGTARHARAERLTAALVERLWDPASGMFLCRDLRAPASDDRDPHGTAPDRRVGFGTAPDHRDPFGTEADRRDPHGASPDGRNPRTTTPDHRDLHGTSPDGRNPRATEADRQNPLGTSSDSRDPFGTEADRRDLHNTSPDGRDPFGTEADRRDLHGTSPDGRNTLRTEADRQNPLATEADRQNPLGIEADRPDPRATAPDPRGALIPERTVSGLVPLLLPGLPRDIVRTLLRTASGPHFGLGATTRLLPSYDLLGEAFDPHRYWRGPAWFNTAWLLERGLRTHGQLQQADALRESVLELAETTDFAEYVDPYTGEACGATGFSWTAALSLDLLHSDTTITGVTTGTTVTADMGFKGGNRR